MTQVLGPSQAWPTESVGGDAMIVRCSGVLDRRRLTLALRTADHAARWVILDLGNIPEFDRQTLALIVRAQRRLDARGSRLALWRLRGQPHRLVHESGTFRLIEVIDGPLDRWWSTRAHLVSARPATWYASRAGTAPGVAGSAPGSGPRGG